MTQHRRPPMAGTFFNDLAGEYLRSKRAKLGLSQPAFAAELSMLVDREISPSSLSYFESARHSVPAAVLLAAQSMQAQQLARRRRRVKP